MKIIKNVEDITGINTCKGGFFKQLQQKISELKIANQQLETKRHEMEAVLEGITDLMLIIGEDFIIHQVNKVAEDWFPGKQFENKLCYKVLKNRSRPCTNCPAQRSLAQSKMVKDVFSLKLKGQLRYYEVIASPIEHEDTDQPKTLVFVRDITRDRKFQMKYAQAEKMATVGALAAGIAHEINNPLTSISGFAQGLQRRVGKLSGKVDSELVDDFEEYTETIIAECLRCRDIVKTMLTFSRPTESARGLVRLNQCVGDILFILQHHLRDHHNITVTTKLDPSLPPIMGDESQLKQVIINLVLNAFDAMKDGGNIQIITQKTVHNRVKLIVIDTGSGISEDIQEKLFDPFFSTKQVGKGVGIGLSTCYNIVTNHKGSISACNNVDKGASFAVILPEAKL
ncbi:MAG: ATP-binding protein [Desulfotalea sp.]